MCERVTWREATLAAARGTGSCVSWPLALMEPRTRPRIRSRKATAAGRHTDGSIDDAKRMAQCWDFVEPVTRNFWPTRRDTCT
jgi:hypothetical protein